MHYNIPGRIHCFKVKEPLLLELSQRHIIVTQEAMLVLQAAGM